MAKHHLKNIQHFLAKFWRNLDTIQKYNSKLRSCVSFIHIFVNISVEQLTTAQDISTASIKQRDKPEHNTTSEHRGNIIFLIQVGQGPSGKSCTLIETYIILHNQINPITSHDDRR